MHLLVDPVLYAVPNAEDDNETFERYIEHLSLWSDELRSKRHNFYVWQECIDALNAAGCFPYPPILKKLWARMDEQIISSDIAFAACRSLFEPPNLEDWIEDPNLYDMLVDEERFKVMPELLDRLPPEVADAFQQALGKVAYVKKSHQELPLADLHLVTHPVVGEKRAEITAYVVANSHSAEVEEELLLITKPEDLDALLKLADQWQDAKQAIEWLARQMIHDGELPPDTQLAPFVVGPNFVASIAKHHFDKNPGWLKQIYRRCVLLLTGWATSDPKKHHTLDKHKQRMHGSWGAWRIHVTGSPMAIRLHYWRSGNKYILMHNVPHEDYDMDDPPANAFI
jgi:hypothetical protein